MSKKCNFLKALFLVAAFMLVLPIAVTATGGTGVDSIPYDVTKIWRTNATVAQAQAIFTFKGPDGKIYQPVCVQAGNEVEIRMPNGFIPGKWVLMQYGIENRPFTVESLTPEQWLENEIKRAQLYIAAGDDFEWHSSTFPANLKADVDIMFNDQKERELAKAEIMIRAEAEYYKTRKDFDKAGEIVSEAMEISNRLDPSRNTRFFELAMNVQEVKVTADSSFDKVMAALAEIEVLAKDALALCKEREKMLDNFFDSDMTEGDYKAFQAEYDVISKKIDENHSKHDNLVQKFPIELCDNLTQEQLKEGNRVSNRIIGMRSEISLFNSTSRYNEAMKEYYNHPNRARAKIAELESIQGKMSKLMDRFLAISRLDEVTCDLQRESFKLHQELLTLMNDEARVYSELWNITAAKGGWILSEAGLEMGPAISNINKTREKLGVDKGEKEFEHKLFEVFTATQVKAAKFIFDAELKKAVDKAEGADKDLSPVVYASMRKGVLEYLNKWNSTSDYFEDQYGRQWSNRVDWYIDKVEKDVRSGLSALYKEYGYQLTVQGVAKQIPATTTAPKSQEGKQDTSGDSSRAKP